MAEQLPIEFEFRANQTFAEYFPGGNEEIIGELKKAVAGIGEQLLFLWGNTGQGKSHLLHACCHEASLLGFSAFYLNCRQSAVLPPDVFNGLEGIDVVCIDNLDGLAGFADLELALFNFFNQHRSNGRRLILSASCAPKVIALALPDLKTRINWGLSLKIQPLADNDKIAALSHKAQQLGFEFTPKAVKFLLTRYDRSLSSLWLALNRLDAASLSAQRKLTIPFLKEVLKNEP